MNERIQKLIEDWESISSGRFETTATRTAALLSAYPNVPEQVLEALARIEQGNTSRSQDIFTVVQYLRTLVAT